MIKTNTVYKVPDILDDFEVFSTPVGIWCTDNLDCEKMSIKDAMNHSKCINGNIVNESIKNVLFLHF